jgi:hypothetical protein
VSHLCLQLLLQLQVDMWRLVSVGAVHTVLRTAVVGAAWPCPGPKGYWSLFELVAATTMSMSCMVVQHCHSAFRPASSQRRPGHHHCCHKWAISTSSQPLKPSRRTCSCASFDSSRSSASITQSHLRLILEQVVVLHTMPKQSWMNQTMSPK